MKESKTYVCWFTKTQFEIWISNIIINLCIYINIYIYVIIQLCIYVFISFESNTFFDRFEIRYHVIKSLRKIFKKTTTTLYCLFVKNIHENNDMLFLLIFIFSENTKHQPKNCPNKYLKWPKKQSWNASWEVPKT